MKTNTPLQKLIEHMNIQLTITDLAEGGTAQEKRWYKRGIEQAISNAKILLEAEKKVITEAFVYGQSAISDSAFINEQDGEDYFEQTFNQQ